MSEREFNIHDDASPEFRCARLHDDLYAEILLRCGVFQDDAIPGGDESELRELVGMFLSSRAGVDPERAHTMANDIVPYYDGYAYHCEEGDLARDVIPTIFSRAVVEAGLSGDTDMMSELLNAHSYAGLVSPTKTFHLLIHQELSEEIESMIKLRLAAEAEALSIVKGQNWTRPKIMLAATVDMLCNHYLLDTPESKRLLRYAQTGQIKRLPFRWFSR